jgi:2-keto-4-pentenoate hydratase/2-oxohepta-3-ene-1,7-dioic acid hydratase in catechol pathway
VIGAYDPVEVPPGCELLDFELEFAAVVGRRGRNVGPEEAGDFRLGLEPHPGIV